MEPRFRKKFGHTDSKDLDMAMVATDPFIASFTFYPEVPRQETFDTESDSVGTPSKKRCLSLLRNGLAASQTSLGPMNDCDAGLQRAVRGTTSDLVQLN